MAGARRPRCERPPRLDSTPAPAGAAAPFPRKDMYAIVRVGAKQYRVEKGDSLVVDRLPEDEGAKVTLEPLLLRPDDGEPVFAPSELAKVKVEAVVRGHERGPKVHVLKFKPKRGYRRRQGHRSELTRLEIGDIRQLSRRPAATKKQEQGNGS
jgi:large subunit ribosomal protein L21